MITDLFSLPTFQPTQSLSHTNNNGDGDDEQLTLLTYLLVTYYVVADVREESSKIFGLWAGDPQYLQGSGKH
ncbi:hypothetical protein YQE_02152, partial [Dendroctonus ponderosae]